MAAKAAADPQVLVALTSFVGVDGEVIPEGTLVASDTPAATKWPELFRAVTATPRIEQATAAPGEKRGA